MKKLSPIIDSEYSENDFKSCGVSKSDFDLIKKHGFVGNAYDIIVLSNLAKAYGSPDVLEIGSGSGGSATCFYLANKNAKLTSIDPFVGMDDNIANYDFPYYETACASFTFDGFAKNVEAIGLKVRSIRELSENVKLEEKFDIIYLDGDHQYITVFSDLLQFFNNLKTGGAMLVHDYKTILSVKTAVRDFCDLLSLTAEDPHNKANLAIIRR